MPVFSRLSRSSKYRLHLSGRYTLLGLFLRSILFFNLVFHVKANTLSILLSAGNVVVKDASYKLVPGLFLGSAEEHAVKSARMKTDTTRILFISCSSFSC